MAVPAARAAWAAKRAAKYGPYVLAAWKVGGPQAVEAAKKQAGRLLERRHAVDKARTVADGSVLRVRDGNEVAWVVFTGNEPVASYPESSTPLTTLVAHADLSRRRTPAEVDAARLHRRARRIAPRALR